MLTLTRRAAALALGTLPLGSLTWSGPARAQAAARPPAELLAPADLLATFTGNGLAEAVLLPQLLAQLGARAQSGKMPAAEVAGVLARFDQAEAALCLGIRSAYAAHQPQLAATVAKHLQGQGVPGEAGFLLDPKVADWARRNNQFLTLALPLTTLRLLVEALNPGLLEPPLRPASVLVFGTPPDGAALEAFQLISAGQEALIERRMLALLLASASFSRLLPERYQAAALQRSEASLRKEGEALLRRAPGRLDSFDKGLSLTRRQLLDFASMRELGLERPYTEAVAAVRKIG